MAPLTSRRASTMIELLIVIAVVSVLAGLIVTAVHNAREAANRTRCANNLHQIGLAYDQFVTNRGGKTTAFKGDITWVDKLMPYVEGNEQVFHCPIAPHPPRKSTRIETIGPPPIFDLGIYSRVLNKNISLAQQGTIYHNSKSVGRDPPANQSRFPEWRNGAFQVECTWASVAEYLRPGPNDYWVYVLAAPTPDFFPTNSMHWYLDSNYAFFVLVEANVQVEAKVGNDVVQRSGIGISIYGARTPSPPTDIPSYIPPGEISEPFDTYDLVRLSTGEILIENITASDNPKARRWRPVYVVSPNDIGVPRSASNIVQVVPDYGINSKTSFFSPGGDSDKVLALEYNKPIAKVAGTDATDLALWPKLAAARHHGTLNVLFKGGHVRAMTPREIDPGYSEVQNANWLPERLGK